MQTKTKRIDDRRFLSKLSNIKVLIIDDQSNMVRTLANMLVDVCVLVNKTKSLRRAYNGKEAIDLIESGIYYDLILLDWNMPKIPGIEVLRKIRNSKNKKIQATPVIMITGEADKRDVNSAVHEGADTYLLKPFLVKDLKERMIPLLRRHWSGIERKKGTNRRSETRFRADDIMLEVEAEFDDGSKATPEIINISEHGLRLKLSENLDKTVKAIYFPTKDGGKNFANKMKVKQIEIDQEAKEYKEYKGEISLHFDKESASEEIHERWLEWIEVAKARDFSYRTQSF